MQMQFRNYKNVLSMQDKNTENIGGTMIFSKSHYIIWTCRNYSDSQPQYPVIFSNILQMRC